jgi:hypothetical protein
MPPVQFFFVYSVASVIVNRSFAKKLAEQ